MSLLLQRGAAGFLTLAGLLVVIAALLGLLIAQQFNPAASIRTMVQAASQARGDLGRFFVASGLQEQAPPEVASGGASGESGAVPTDSKKDSQTGPAPRPARSPATLAGLIAAIVGLVTVLRQAQTQLSAFGVKGWKWLDWMKDGIGVGGEGSAAQTRMQFARQFEEVVTALGDMRLVILIDDLDRCRPENVVELLEGVNFLVSSASCFVVMGFDRNWVHACVALEYERIAKAVADRAEEEPQGASAMRRDFAAQYLQKLINIEVPVPKADLEGFGKVIRLSDAPAPVEYSRFEKVLVKGWNQLAATWSTSLVRFALVGLIALGFVAGGRLLDDYLRRDAVVGVSPPVSSDETSLKAAAIAATAEAGGRANRNATLTPGGTALAESPVPAQALGPTTFSAGMLPSRGVGFWLLFAVVLAVLVLVIVAYFNRPRDLPGDSEWFTKSVEVWDDLVFEQSKTPRAAKQFKNRVRLFAMRSRGYPPTRPRVLRTLDWLRSVPDGATSLLSMVVPRVAGRTGPQAPPTPAEITDAALVALGAIESVQREWLTVDSNWDALCRKQLDDLVPARKELIPLLKRLLAEHSQLDKGRDAWPPSDALRRRVIEYSTGAVTPVAPGALVAADGAAASNPA